jgi:hypothetical protein
MLSCIESAKDVRPSSHSRTGFSAISPSHRQVSVALVALGDYIGAACSGHFLARVADSGKLPTGRTNRVDRMSRSHYKRQTSVAPMWRRWRRGIVRYLLVALALPLAGPLPWLVTHSEWHEHHAESSPQHVAGSHDTSHRHHHHDVSEVPGAPAHPDNHNCFECQVLACLSGCLVGDNFAPSVPPAIGESGLPRDLTDQQPKLIALSGPPIRGPPSSLLARIHSLG